MKNYREHEQVIPQMNALQWPGDPNPEVNKVKLTPVPKFSSLLKASGR